MFSTAKRWDHVERCFGRMCRARAVPDCLPEVSMAMLNATIDADRSWAEQTFDARCGQGLGRWCFIRGALAHRTRRDGREWFKRGCELGDADCCRELR